MSSLGLTNEEIFRLRSSFFELIPVSEDLSALFYQKLFEKYPEVKTYFKSDMESQQDKLVDMLAVILDTLERTEETTVILQDLGRRHVQFGATQEHYGYIEIAFLELISQYAKPEEHDELLAVWSRLMNFVSVTMLDGVQVKDSAC